MIGIKISKHKLIINQKIFIKNELKRNILKLKLALPMKPYLVI
jgi:hypothetical protein